jgi:hypothetical protein
MMKSSTRRTRTIAIPSDLHDQLRIAALQQSLQYKRRITLQELAEKALSVYLDQLKNNPSLHE